MQGDKMKQSLATTLIVFLICTGSYVIAEKQQPSYTNQNNPKQ